MFYSKMLENKYTETYKFEGLASIKSLLQYCVNDYFYYVKFMLWQNKIN